jgi:3'-phosphoadenosine 5'-phosphosulfate sulfotransferase (PAPS reductase)/FAD synthetase
MSEESHSIWTTPPKRVICWWSAGVTSAIATYLAIKKYKGKLPIKIIYCDTGSEHYDNERFLKDCESVYKIEIQKIKNPNFKDTWDVFKKTRYLAGISGARCTGELKKWVRKEIENPKEDIQVYGFDNSEEIRIERFIRNNPEVRLYLPLIENNLTKKDCLTYLVDTLNIKIPIMYKLGYKNNNCIGCVKGGMGYWNKIRKDFPEVFSRMAKMERKLNVALCKTYAIDGKRKRVFLDELDPKLGRYENELKNMECGIVCGE